MVLALVCVLSAVHAQTTVKISGTVIDRKTREAVPYVHIYTKQFTRGTSTDEQGHFEISIHRTDTLIFSSVGFDKYEFHLNQEEIRSYYEVVIEMDFKTYELEPVTVSAYQNLDQFKQSVLELNIATPQKKFQADIPKDAYKQLPSNNMSLNGGASIRGPASALYDAFSKEGKQRRKLATYHQRAAEEEIIASRYNLEVVKRITQLNDEGASRFMEWCKLEDGFILASTEYELTVAMLKCLEGFPPADTVK